jgi:hypothetical protein
MSFTYLTGENIYHSFLSGANQVIAQKKILNDINVFPVPDGDTGNNLASTMSTIIEETKVDANAYRTFQSIADAALTGARGNSGIIFAQYINGISSSLADEEVLSIRSFAESVKNAVPHAYNAISNPVEGTMITVIRDWAEAVHSRWEQATDFYDLMIHSLDVAMDSLKQTTEKLKVLKDASVVDSGAKGFVHFVEGFAEFLKTGIVEKLQHQEDIIEFGEHPEHVHDRFDHRYCTEGLIARDGLDLEKIRSQLEDLGDSLIVAGSDRKARIHLHTNHPDQVFMVLRTHGKILQQKVDDMKGQYDAIYNRKYPVALVTDSIADLPKEWMDRYQIHLIPLNLMMEDTAYLDKVTITSENFYRLLDEVDTYPTSAQPNGKVVEGILSSLAAHYDSIIVVTVAKALSGTHQTIQHGAAKLRETGKHITVVDSKQNSGAQGLLVMKAAEWIHEGKSHDEVVHLLEEQIPRTKIFVSVNTLKYMVRSGRVNKMTGLLAKWMNLKPVISLDDNGMGTILDKAFSLQGNTAKIKKRVVEMKRHYGNLRYAIIHAGSEKRASEYVDLFRGILEKDPEYVMSISPIVAMSAGIGCVAIALIADEQEAVS